MADVDALSIVVRLIGLVTALLGAAAAVPLAVWRLSDEAAERLKALQARIRGRSGSAPLVGGASVDTAVTAQTIASAVTMAGTSTFMQQLAALQERVTQLERTVRTVSDDLQVEIETRKDADTRLAGQIWWLEAEIRKLEKASIEIDAHAFPVVAVGIVITGIGDWLASNPWSAAVSIVVGVGSSIYALIILERSRRAV